MNSGSGFADLLSILVNLSDVFPALFMLIVILFTLAGVMLVTMGVYGYYVMHGGNGKWVSGREVTNAGCISNMVIGAMLTSIVLVTALTKNTLLGTEVANGAMGLSSAGMSAQQQAAIAAIFGLFTILGLVATGRGWWMLNDYFNGSKQEWGGAVWFIVGGALCVYMEESLAKISLWTGFDFVKIFLF